MPPSDFAIPKSTLDSERFKLVREIFLDAQRFRGAARQSFLNQRCGGDPGLHRQVADLLKLDESDTSVLDKPVIQAVDEITERPHIPVPHETVGKFRLLQVLGEGGNGVTSLARNPDSRSRRATVKVVHRAFALTGSDGQAALSRVQVDLRALASLKQHSSARLLDCAMLAKGGMYVATDFVPGEPILQYCDRVRATIRARLLLFLDVCEAVHAAHQCGVLHAGLTPGNVLVRMAGDVPTAMLLDFGIARALHDLLGQRRTWLELRLAHGAVEYLAPEQAAESPRPADPAADIYALGALLYELLTGLAPFDRHALRRAGIGDFPRILAEQQVLDPEKQLDEHADRLIDFADRRATGPAELRATLARELGGLPMKALCKSGASRYQTVGALADDIRSYLDGNLAASPNGLGGQLRRLIGRFRKES